MEGILQWLKEGPPSRSALTGKITAVIGPPTFKLETAVLSMCLLTSVVHPGRVAYAIVAVTEPEKYSYYLCIVSKSQVV